MLRSVPTLPASATKTVTVKVSNQGMCRLAMMTVMLLYTLLDPKDTASKSQKLTHMFSTTKVRVANQGL